MKRIIAIILSTTLIIAAFGWATNMVYYNMGYTSPVVTYMYQINVNGIKMWKYDFYNYIDNIIFALKTPFQVNFNFVTYEWQATNNFVADISHNIGLIANFFILIINLILLPFNIIGYVITVICSLVGIPLLADSSNPLKWLVDIGTTLRDITVNYITL